MGEEVSRQNRAWNREMTVNTNLSLDIDKNPTDLSLLRGFMSGKGHGGGETDCDGESSIELNLGLSLGGKFGVDKTPKKLERSSSLIGTFNDSRTETVAEMNPENYGVGLVRTTSLPAEMEEEWRKRKEIQSLRRMEAKRRRCEKQSFKGGNFDDQTVSFESERSGFLQRHLVCGDSDGGGGGSSSSLSELDNKTQQGSSNSCNNERSPKIVTGCSSNGGSHGTEQIMASGLFDMPCVFMNGPNGERIDGILYKYGKGQEVRIMCICHGSFLTPAEFVKHGGGGDVDRPLRHIVVNTSSSRF